MQEDLSRILVAHSYSRVVAGTCTADVDVDWLTILAVRLAGDITKTGNPGITAALLCHELPRRIPRPPHLNVTSHPYNVCSRTFVDM